MSDPQLGSLIEWLGTFDLEAPHSTAEDISDGVALAEALSQIAPEWFSPSWRGKIKSALGTNWRLKVSNLRKIIEAVMEYYMECLNQQLSDYVKPDATKIGEHCNERELRRLLQLVLGCAVNCENKQSYITRIMKMEETVQRAIMQSIQELEGSMHGPRLSLGASLNLESLDVADGAQQRLLAELQSAVDTRDQLAQRCHELEQRLTLLQEEKTSVTTENKKLQERLEEYENSEDSGTSLRYSGLRKRVEELKDEVFKLETSRDDYRLKMELLEKENLELQLRQEELQKSADQARHLKDEIDALKETADKVAKYESTIESYKKKMEDFSDLRRQVKMLEDKNIEYMQCKIDYEEEAKKGTLLRNHLEVCKQQLAEVHRKLDEQSNKCDKLEFEAKKMETRLNSVVRERDRLVVERDALKETNEELKCAQLQAGENSSNLSGKETDPITDMIPLEIKEKLLHLQHENKMLKIKQQGSEDKLPMVQALLEDSEERMNTLREQNRQANQKIIELENKLEETAADQASEGKSDSVTLQRKILQLQEELRKVQLERERLTVQMEERESAFQAQKQKNFALQENLTRKECEAAALEERYKKYIEKAKNVIKSIDPKQTTSSPMENTTLRNLLTQKQRIIDELQRKIAVYDNPKLFKEMEDRFTATAFYSLNCHRDAIDQRLVALNSGQGQSFLARQRQPSSRRQNQPPYNSK